MSSKSIPVLIPAAELGMYPKDNILKIPATALAEALGITFETDTLEKEPGASPIDSSGITGAPTVLGTFGSTVEFIGQATAYTCTATPTVTSIDTEAGAASRTSFTLTSAGGTTAGNDIIVTVAGKGLVTSLLSVADDKSNTYTLEQTGRVPLSTGTHDSRGTLSASTASTHNYVAAFTAGPDLSLQNLGGSSVGTGGIATLSGLTTTSGSSILVGVMRYQIAGTFGSSSVTDTAGNTYTRVASKTVGSRRTEYWIANSTTALSGGTINAQAFGVTNDIQIVAVEANDTYLSQVEVADARQENFTAAPDSNDLTTLNTAVNDYLLVGFHWIQDKQATTTWTAGADYTTQATADDTVTTAGGSQMVMQTRHIQNIRVAIFRATNTTALAAADDITVTASGATQMYGAALEFNNFSAVDAVAEQVAHVATTAVSIGPVGPLQGLPSLVIGAIAANDPTSNAYTEEGTWTLEHDVNDATSDTQLQVQYKIITSQPSIIGLFSWESDLSGPRGGSTPATNLTGTVDTTQGSAVVDANGGAGTSFDTEVRANDFITVGTETRRVESVDSAIKITCTEAWQTNNTNANALRVAGRKIITYASDGNIYKEEADDLDAVTLASGLSTTTRHAKFTSAGREATGNIAKLFWCNGVNTVQVLDADASSMGAISNPNVDWSANNQPVGMVVHTQGLAQRLVAFGVRDNPHTLYYSDDDDHEDFRVSNADTYRQLVVSSVGKRIFAAASFNGILFVWKWPRGIFFIDDSDIERQNWAIRAKSIALGCAPSPQAVLPMDDDVMFMAQDGSFHLLSAVNTLGGTRASDLSYALGITQWIRDNINTTKLDQVQSVWDPNTKTAYWGLPATGESTNSVTLKFDFGLVQQGGPVRFSRSTRDAPESMATTIDITTGREQPMIGETTNVYILNQSARSKDSLGYTGEFHTARTDLGDFEPQLRMRKKSFDAIEILFDPVDAGTLNVDVYVDGVARGGTLSFDATTERKRRTLKVGQGYDIQIRGSNTLVSESFKVQGIILWVTPAGEDQR